MMLNSLKKEGRRRSHLWLCGLLLLSSALAPSARANSSMFSGANICTVSATYCTALSLYGVFQDDAGAGNSTLAFNTSAGKNWSITDIGVGAGANLSTGSNAQQTAVTGIVDFANTPSALNSSCTGTPNYCGTTALSVAPTSAHASRVNNADSALDSIITTLAAYNTNTTGSTTALTSMAGLLTSGGVNIIKQTSNYTQPTTGLTFNCTGGTCNGNTLAIVILAGSSSSFGRNITLGGGLTSDQVIFYIPTGSMTINPAVSNQAFLGDIVIGSTASASIGATSGSNSLSLTGHVYSDGGNLTFNNRGGTQSDDGAVPEPGTWALLAGGLSLILWKARRRRVSVRA